MAHDVRLIPPIYVKPYVKRGKNDTADAAAICAALSRHAVRSYQEQREPSDADAAQDPRPAHQAANDERQRVTQPAFGMIAAKGISRIDELVALAEGDAALPHVARGAAKVLAGQIEDRDKSLDKLEAEIAAAHAASAMSHLRVEVPGIGNSPQALTAIASLIATAIVANMPGVCKSGRDFSAWLGLVPRQNSSGGKQTLGAKQGNRYLRKLRVLYQPA